MTVYGFPSLPNELALQIASDADDASLLSLILCNSSLYTLLTPVLHARAVLSRGPQTAMQWAAAQGHISLIKVFTPAHCTTSTTHLFQADTVQFLIARGVHPDDGASNQISAALRAAVVHGRTDIVDLLASNGADLNRQNYCGQSTFYPVIHDAAANGDTSMIKLLASRGAQVASENVMGLYVGTPLHMAVLCSHDAAVHTLLELGVPVDTEDSNCEFPLGVAAMVASEDGYGGVVGFDG